MNFCELIKYLRLEKGATQKEVADGCNLTPTCICQLETGARHPTGSTIRELARYFGVSADYLLGLEDDFGVRTAAPAPNTGNESYSAEERELIKKYRSLSPELKEMLNGIIGTWTQENEINFTKRNKKNV